MRYEVEVKARIEDPAAVRARLIGLGAVGGAGVTRRDTYYARRALDPGCPGAARDLAFRLREEPGAAPEITLKAKRVEGGVETNREVFFRVDDRTAFETFTEALGYAPAFRKVKAVETWALEGLTVELVRIEGLGPFVEVEALGDDEAEAASLRPRVLAMLARLGIPASAIEPRPYTDLLQGG